MRQHKDQAIVLTRVEYGERDRILTLLCKQKGKVSVLAKGVRSEKSRLAGGIELLSESEVSFIEGKSSIMALTSARLRQHFGELTKDIRRMQCAFSHIKTIHSITDEAAGQDYYDTLLTSLASMNNENFDIRIVDAWFNMRVLHISGSAPNLLLDAVSEAEKFEFDYEQQQFKPSTVGLFSKNDLKVLRLCTSQTKPPKLQSSIGSEARLQQLTQTLLRTNATEL